MTMTEIMKRELNNDLSMVKAWCERLYSAETEEDD